MTSKHRTVDNFGSLPTILALRAQNSITDYLGVVPTGTNWLERLTSSSKSFAVPIQTTAVTFSSLRACTGKTEGEMRAVKDSATNVWGATIRGGGSFHG